MFVNIAVFPLGVTLLQFCVLRSYRDDIVQNTGRAAHLAFLYEAYTTACYQWECVDLLRRVLLTGA